MLRDLTPARFSVALVLNVLTTRDGASPRRSEVKLGWLADIVGSWAGMRRSDGAMRLDVLTGHLRALHQGRWLRDLQCIGRGRVTRVVWHWPSSGDEDPHGVADSLRGYGAFARVPKAVAWDPTLTGTHKKVYSALHWRLYADGASHWSKVIKVTHGQLGELAGLHRNTVGRALTELDERGLLTLHDVGLREPSRIQLVPLTAHYLRLEASTAGRRRRRLWMPMRGLSSSHFDWEYESQTRVAAWREYGQDLAGDPDYWNVPAGDYGPDFDAVLRIVEDLHEARRERGHLA